LLGAATEPQNKHEPGNPWITRLVVAPKSRRGEGRWQYQLARSTRESHVPSRRFQDPSGTIAAGLARLTSRVHLRDKGTTTNHACPPPANSRTPGAQPFERARPAARERGRDSHSMNRVGGASERRPRTVSTQECRRGGAPPPDKPGNDNSSLHVGSDTSMGIFSDPGFSAANARLFSTAPPVKKRRTGGAPPCPWRYSAGGKAVRLPLRL
jgi:hypothetical protein